MAHNHSHHHHHHIDPEAGDRRVAVAVAINLLLTGAQIIGGILAGSLALIADALHNLSDAISLIIAFGARKIARRPATADMTFGFRRAEVVAALINYTTLITVGLYLLCEAVTRFMNPQDVDGWLVVIIAGIALLIDAITALLTFTLAKTSVNMRAAFLHNLADALGSIAVIVAGTLILLYDWRLVDPFVTILIAGYILWHAFREIGVVIRILMEGAPAGFDTDALVERLAAIDGIANIHHLHIWQMDENALAVEAHVVLDQGRWGQADEIKGYAKAMLAEEFDVKHSTLELECAAHACDAPQTIGH